MATELVSRKLRQWDGTEDGWRADLPLRAEETAVEIDASAVRFAVPTFLLRLRAFVDWHLEHGHSVVVRSPTNPAVANYMARMRISKGVPGVFKGLPVVSESSESSDVLIPVCQLHNADDVEALGEKLIPLFIDFGSDVAVFTDAMHMAISELCGNAVEHGVNPLGCYLAAQRYQGPRKTVLALGDLGIGIPGHMRERFDFDVDHVALREAIKEGVSGTGEAHRGNGFYWVMKEARAALIRRATLDLRSGRGRLLQVAKAQPSRLTTRSTVAPYKIGTWATFELGPLTSV